MNPSCLALIVGSIAASAAPLAAPAKAVTPIVSCADLAKVALPEATVTSIESVASEQYKIPQSQQGFAAQPGMNLAGRIELGTNPAFCRFAATLRPSQDSQIRIEVWLPQTAWNGKLLGVGNFGWAGSIPYPGMLVGLQRVEGPELKYVTPTGIFVLFKGSSQRYQASRIFWALLLELYTN